MIRVTKILHLKCSQKLVSAFFRTKIRYFEIEMFLWDVQLKKRERERK